LPSGRSIIANCVPHSDVHESARNNRHLTDLMQFI
jgi:hypothetical protein